MQPYLFKCCNSFFSAPPMSIWNERYRRCFPFSSIVWKRLRNLLLIRKFTFWKCTDGERISFLFATALSHFNDNEKNPNSPTSTIHPSASQLCNSSVIACNVPSRMAGLKPVALWTSSRNLSAGMVPLGRIRAWSSFSSPSSGEGLGSGINRNKHSYNLEYQLGNIIHSMLQEQVLMHRV